MARRKQGYVNKQSEEFIKFILDNYTLDESTGNINTKIYTYIYISVGFKSNTLSVPYSHLVWLLKHKKWPTDGFNIDHIDDNPLNNRPDNLEEITYIDNQAKRKGKGNRSYGTGKCGHGIYINYDKRDTKYYISRKLSRGTVTNHLGKTATIAYGSFKTLELAEQKVKEIIEELNSPVDILKEFGIEDPDAK